MLCCAEVQRIDYNPVEHAPDDCEGRYEMSLHKIYPFSTNTTEQHNSILFKNGCTLEIHHRSGL